MAAPNKTTLPQLPVTTPLTTESGALSRSWILALQALGAVKQMSSSGNLADLPAGLGKDDAGYLYTAVDYARSFRWTGTAWERAEGAADPHRYIWADENPGTGWHLADGSTVTRTKADGTTESFGTKNLIGYYIKGAGAAAAGVAATNPSATGATDAVSAGTPAGSVTVDPSSGSTNVVQGTGSITAVASTAHTHDGHFSGSALPDHDHTVSLTFTAAGEPAHASLIPYYRL
jgi:hypothetical protein